MPPFTTPTYSPPRYNPTPLIVRFPKTTFQCPKKSLIFGYRTTTKKSTFKHLFMRQWNIFFGHPIHVNCIQQLATHFQPPQLSTWLGLDTNHCAPFVTPRHSFYSQTGGTETVSQPRVTVPVPVPVPVPVTVTVPFLFEFLV